MVNFATPTYVKVLPIHSTFVLKMLSMDSTNN